MSAIEHSRDTLAEIDELIATLDRFKALAPQVEAAGQLLVKTLKTGHKILTCGNGGSAADACHLSEELVGRFLSNRRALPSICLSADGPLLTCIANDFGFDALFARQVEGLGREGDVLVIFSTSGNSENLVRALRQAKSMRLGTIAIFGKDGGRARDLAEYEIVVPSQVTARVQEVHTLILHLWMSMIEEEFSSRLPQ